MSERRGFSSDDCLTALRANAAAIRAASVSCSDIEADPSIIHGWFAAAVGAYRKGKP